MDNVISAKEALGQYKLNAIKYEAADALEKLQKIKEAETRKKQIEDEWIEKTIRNGGRIIDCIINDGPKFQSRYLQYGVGKKNKLNGYYIKFQSGHIQLHPYEFDENISDDAIKQVKDYFEDLGYGCEIKKKQKYSSYTEPGTMYLWIPSEEDIKEAKRLEAVKNLKSDCFRIKINLVDPEALSEFRDECIKSGIPEHTLFCDNDIDNNSHLFYLTDFDYVDILAKVLEKGYGISKQKFEEMTNIKIEDYKKDNTYNTGISW